VDAVVDHAGPERASDTRRRMLERCPGGSWLLPGPGATWTRRCRMAIEIDRLDETTGVQAGSG
jgi:hypothetical protein